MATVIWRVVGLFCLFWIVMPLFAAGAGEKCIEQCQCFSGLEKLPHSYPSSPWFLVKLHPGDSIHKVRRLYGCEDTIYQTKLGDKVITRYGWQLAPFFLDASANELGEILEISVIHRGQSLTVPFGVELGKDTPEEVVRKTGYKKEGIWSRIRYGEGAWYYDICLDIGEGGAFTIRFGFALYPEENPDHAKLINAAHEVTAETFATIPVSRVELSYSEYGLCAQYQLRKTPNKQ